MWLRKLWTFTEYVCTHFFKSSTNPSFGTVQFAIWQWSLEYNSSERLLSMFTHTVWILWNLVILWRKLPLRRDSVSQKKQCDNAQIFVHTKIPVSHPIPITLSELWEWLSRIPSHNSSWGRTLLRNTQPHLNKHPQIKLNVSSRLLPGLPIRETMREVQQSCSKLLQAERNRCDSQGNLWALVRGLMLGNNWEDLSTFCLHALTAQIAVISRFLCNFFPELLLNFFVSTIRAESHSRKVRTGTITPLREDIPLFLSIFSIFSGRCCGSKPFLSKKTCPGRLTQTPCAGTGACAWRYRCSIVLICKGNLSMNGTFLIWSLPPPDKTNPKCGCVEPKFTRAAAGKFEQNSKLIEFTTTNGQIMKKCNEAKMAHLYVYMYICIHQNA